MGNSELSVHTAVVSMGNSELSIDAAVMSKGNWELSVDTGAIPMGNSELSVHATCSFAGQPTGCGLAKPCQEARMQYSASRPAVSVLDGHCLQPEHLRR